MLIIALVFFTLSVALAVFGLGSPNPNRGDILIAAILPESVGRTTKALQRAIFEQP